MKSQPTVLIADDESEIRNVLQRFLLRQGYEPMIACDGKEALNKTKNQKPDIVLLDINMPEMDGLTVCRKLREDPTTRLTPILMLTSRGSTQDKVAGLNIGADDYLSKPFELSELQARIDVLLRRTRQMISVNPLTRLPGNTSIQDEINRRLKSGKKFGAAYIDVDNFKSYNDVYGYHQGDLLIVWLAKTIRDVLQKSPRAETEDSPFLGHVGGDDFMVVSEAESMPALCAAITEDFDKNRSIWYNWWHSHRGFITTKDRQGNPRRFPLMTLSIGVSTNERRSLVHYAQVSQITSELKCFAKTRVDKKKSAVFFDKRKD